jgi:diguanylate cyclase (GGDEF)-like protein
MLANSQPCPQNDGSFEREPGLARPAGIAPTAPPVHVPMLNPAVALATSTLTSFVLLLLLGSLLRSGMAGVREWFAANLLAVVALPLVMMRGWLPDAVSVVAANMLLALSAASFYAGCARFLGRPPRWPILGAGAAVLGIALVYGRYVVDSIPLRVLWTALFTFTICIAVATVVARNRPPGSSAYPRWVMAALSLAFGVSQVARGVWFQTLSGPSSPQMFATPGSVALLVVNAALLPMLSMAAMMMVHDALLNSARDAANRDFLTGALSRKGLEAVVAARLGEAARDDTALSLMIIDLDHFKSINDTFGHPGGDAVLRSFASAARAQLRGTGVLARLGGEEFAIVLPQTSGAEALRLAERLRSAVAAQAVETASGICRYTMSGGVAEWVPDERFEQLSRRADLALYSAKRTGRDRVCAWDPAETPSHQPVLADTGLPR